VEYALKAASSGSNTAIAVRGQTASVVITQKKVPDRLIDPSCITHIYEVTNEIAVLMLGLLPDIQHQVQRMRYEASKFKYDHGIDMSVYGLAQRMADIIQVNTQEARGRLMACSILIIGHDDERGSQVYKIDAAGHFFPYKAAATGKLESDAKNFLEKQVDSLATLGDNDAIELAISAMQYILSTDFKSSELEIGIVSRKATDDTKWRYRQLSDVEIEERLNSITEKADS
jgi:20S proteasome subunit alpha 1